MMRIQAVDSSEEHAPKIKSRGLGHRHLAYPSKEPIEDDVTTARTGMEPVLKDGQPVYHDDRVTCDSVRYYDVDQLHKRSILPASAPKIKNRGLGYRHLAYPNNELLETAVTAARSVIEPVMKDIELAHEDGPVKNDGLQHYYDLDELPKRPVVPHTATPVPQARIKSSEVTPLLPKTESYGTATHRPRPNTGGIKFGFQHSLLAGEFRYLAILASQMLLSNVIDYMPGFVSGVLTGHLSNKYSSEYLAAKSLSAVFSLLTGYTVNVAIGAAMDTLCAQAYGAGKLHEMGIFFQTGILIFLTFAVPLCIISYFCVDLLVLLGQQRTIAVLARNLVLCQLPSLPFSVINGLLCRILQGQNLIKPMIYAGILANIVHDVLIYVLMFHTSLGYIGGSIANSALIMVYTVVLCVYFFRSHIYEREWPGWRLRDALKVMPEFAKLGVSGLMMFVFEYWGFAAVSLFAGALPYAAVAMSADSTYASFRVLSAIFYGTIAVAGSVRVGNALGANDPDRAKAAAYLSVALSIACTTVTSFVMFSVRHIYPYAYTTDLDVVYLTGKLMLLTSPFQVFAGIACAVQGIFRGSGLQSLGARLNFVSYIVIALPVGLTLGYQLEMGLVGLWTGLCIGLLCSGSYSIYWLLQANWQQMAVDAQKRTREPADISPNPNSCI